MLSHRPLTQEPPSHSASPLQTRSQNVACGLGAMPTGHGLKHCPCGLQRASVPGPGPRG
jgi:hypothetical protein